jgi:hypothetical protein
MWGTLSRWRAGWLGEGLPAVFIEEPALAQSVHSVLIEVEGELGGACGPPGVGGDAVA